MNWKKILLTVAIVDVLGLNAAVGYVFWQYRDYWLRARQPVAVSGSREEEEGCGAECEEVIEGKFAQLRNDLLRQVAPTPPPPPTPQAVSKPPARSKTRSVSYVAIPVGGSTQSNAWADLPGTDFYFNTVDYPGLVEIYFEANVRLLNGNGMAYFRLYDASHGIGVQGSEVQTAKQTSTALASGKVTFWAGKNLIRVQARSLTADTAVFDSGRLRIVTEN